MHRALLLSLGCLLLAACGGDGPNTPAATSPTGTSTGTSTGPMKPAVGANPGPVSRPRGPGIEAQEPGQRPAPPGRLFSSRFKPFGPWFDALVERINPASKADPWPTEVIAGIARRELRKGLLDSLSGERPPLGGVVGPRFTAATALRPDELRMVHERGLKILRGEPAPLVDGDPRAHDIAALLAHLCGPFTGRGNVDVEVWVVGSSAEGQRFKTRCYLRLSASDEQGTLQTNVEFSAGWRVNQGRVNLTRVEGHAFEQLQGQGPLFEDLTGYLLGDGADPGGWLWQGALERASVTDNSIPFTDVYLAMHGLGVGDLDGDGLEDVYVARHAGEPNVLLRHLPDGRTVDIAPEAGVDFLDDTGAVLIVDLDGDGARDLVLGIGGDLLVAWNDGGGRFPERTRLSRAADKDKVYTLTAADADGDGDLDLYDTRYFRGNYNAGGGVPTPYHDAQNGARNSLWRNGGGRQFIEATEELGLEQGNDRFSLAALWEDLDGDGDLDLYVVNDFGRNNFYLRGDDGRYRDEAGSRGLSDMAAGMGVTCADADGDGVLDLYVTNMFTAAGRRVTQTPRFAQARSMGAMSAYQRHTRGNTLLLGRGDGKFRDATEETRSGPGGWAWGALFADWDLDGLPDLYVPNGFITGHERRDLEGFFWRHVVSASPAAPPAGEEYENAWRAITRLSQQGGLSWNGNERNYVYWNLGGAAFADASRVSAGGLIDDSRVAATCDWDDDGRVDLWLKNRTAPIVRYLRNDLATDGHWVSFELLGQGPNTEAVGALVTLEAGGRTQKLRVYAGEGYLGCPSKRLHFGLGDAETIEQVLVDWPDGGRTTYSGLAADGRYRVSRDGGLELVARPETSPLANAPVDPMPRAEGVSGTRAVALERFPFAAMPLPTFDGSTRTVADAAGRSLLLYVWGSWDEAASEGLGELARAAAELSAGGVEVHPVSFDSVRNQDFALNVVRRSGLANLGGRAGRREAVLLELAFQAILPGYEDLPVPLGLLFDPHGRVCVIYVGRVDPLQVAADGLALAQNDGEWRTTRCLTQGRWIADPPTRRLEGAIGFLRGQRGERGLAEGLEAFAARRGK
jgi:ASPIC and UnbV/FG-GAP-like repeat